MIVLFGFTSLVLLATAVPALADEISGGCTATINGRDVADITKSDPLVLEEGAITVDATGSVPPAALAAPASQVTTTFEVHLADAGFLPGTSESGTGHTFSGRAEIPGWVRNLAAGLWKLDASATGSPGDWQCSASIYIKVGGPLTVATAVGAGAAIAGAALASPVQSLSSPGRSPRPNQRRDNAVDRGLDAAALAATVLVAYVVLGLLEVV
jgi:hypothetical protein